MIAYVPGNLSGINSRSMKKPSTFEDQFKQVANKARNESQKSLLLRFVLDKTMTSCADTLQHARELRNPRNKSRRKAV